MKPPEIEITTAGIDETLANQFKPICADSVAAVLELVPLKFPQDAELSILLADDETLRQLNAQWRGKDKPTNVLSFPGRTISPEEEADQHLGDIAISIETAKAEAELENRSCDDHFTHLMVHGFLHLFGYDHQTGEEAEIMENLEIRILAQLGINNPYEGQD